jgi:hypothetical protein
MITERVIFGDYDFRIEDDKIIVGGCDCEEELDIESAEKVYWILDQYLIEKNIISERWG